MQILKTQIYFHTFTNVSKLLSNFKKVNQVKQFQTLLKKPQSDKQLIEMTKQQVVFPLLYKTIFFKKVLIPNCFRFKQRVDYTIFYTKPTHTHNNSSLPSNTMDLETSKL